MPGLFEAEDGTQRVHITVDGLGVRTQTSTSTSTPTPVPTPVRCGVPLPKGRVTDPSQLRLEDARGRPVPVQATVTGFWSDKSLKWLNLDFLASASRYVIVIGSKEIESTGAPRISTSQNGEEITVITGPLKLIVPKEGTTTFPGLVWIDRDGDGEFSDDEIVVEGGRMWVALRGSTTGTFRARTSGVKLETAGPFRATVRVEGRYLSEDGEEVDRFIMRIHAYAGCDFLTVQHSFMNTVDVQYTDTMAVGLEYAAQSAAVTVVTLGIDGEGVTATPAGLLSAVQENARTPEYPKFDQFEPVCTVKVDGGMVATGAKSDGWMSVVSAGGTITIGLRDIWQKLPGGFEVDAEKGSAAVMIVPDTGKPYDWKAGRKAKMTAHTGSPWGSFGDDGIGFTDELILDFGGVGVESLARVKAFCAIPNALVDPRWLEYTRALGYVPAADPEAFPEAERQLDRMVEWLWRHAHEYFHWYGIAWGGIQTHYQPRSGHWSDLTERYAWLNAEADTNAGVLLHYARTGSRKAFLLGRAMLRHDEDVGTSQRSGYGRRHYVYAWGQGGDWPHTQLFSTSIYYHLTGCERTREFIDLTAGVVEAAGTQGSLMRDTHNVIRCALWLYEITGEQKWKRKAEKIMKATLELQGEDGLFGDNGLMTNIYLLWAMELYDRMIGDENVRHALLRCVEANITMPGRLLMDYYAHANAEGLAQAYRYSGGEKRYLWSGLRDLTTIRWTSIYERYDTILRFPRCSYQVPGPDGDVRPDSFIGMHNVGHKLTKLPYLMWAARDAGLTEAKFSEEIDTDQVGVFMPGTSPVAEVDWMKYRPIELSGCNAAPLSEDPFDLGTGLNLAGLPWGNTVVYGGVPFSLMPAAGVGDNAIICLARGESVQIPIGLSAYSLHFLGQVVACTGLEYGRFVGRYVVEFDDDSEEAVEWRNVANCEDWRFEHYSVAAPLAQAWPPRAFDTGDTTLVHVNMLRVDTGGRLIRSVRFEAGDGDSGPMMLAVTAELALSVQPVEPVAHLRFDREDDRALVEPADAFSLASGVLESRGDLTECTVRIPVPEPGTYSVEAVLDSSQPLSIDIQDAHRTVVQAWQLLGEWPTGPSIQHIVFEPATATDARELALHIRLGRGACYQSDEGGGVAWSLGWVFDPRLQRWVILREEYLPPADEEAFQSVEHPGEDGAVAEVWYRQRERWLPAEDTEALFGPKLRIREIVCRSLRS